MASNDGRNRERGADSPPSREAREQGMSGNAGPQAAQTPGTAPQPAQASNRRGAEHQQAPTERKGFTEENAPSEQGEKEHRSAQVIASRQQGIGRQSGSHAGGTDRSEETAQRGGPDGEHTRHGRQHVGGDRPGHRTE